MKSFAGIYSRCHQPSDWLLNDRTFQYDAADRLVSQTDRNGRTTDFTYDALGRLTGEQWIDGGSTVRTLSYQYDAADQLTSASDPAATLDFTYDALGRNTLTDLDYAGLAVDVQLAEAYDRLGRRTGLTAWVDGTADLTNGYVYDSRDRLSRITQGPTAGGTPVAEKRVEFGYQADDPSQLAAIHRFADLAGTQLVASTNYSDDPLDRLTSITHTDAAAVTLAGTGYSYDAAGRMTEMTVTGSPGETVQYSYDTTDQLTAADRAGTLDDESYTYDAGGNRTGTGVTTGSDNRTTSDGTFSYTYDAEWRT